MMCDDDVTVLMITDDHLMTDNYNRNGSFGKGASGGPRNDNNNQSFQRQQDNRGPRVPRGPGGPTGGQNRSMPQAAPSGGNFQK